MSGASNATSLSGQPAVDFVPTIPPGDTAPVVKEAVAEPPVDKAATLDTPDKAKVPSNVAAAVFEPSNAAMAERADRAGQVPAAADGGPVRPVDPSTPGSGGGVVAGSASDAVGTAGVAAVGTPADKPAVVLAASPAAPATVKAVETPQQKKLRLAQEKKQMEAAAEAKAKAKKVEREALAEYAQLDRAVDVVKSAKPDKVKSIEELRVAAQQSLKVFEPIMKALPNSPEAEAYAELNSLVKQLKPDSKRMTDFIPVLQAMKAAHPGDARIAKTLDRLQQLEGVAVSPKDVEVADKMRELCWQSLSDIAADHPDAEALKSTLDAVSSHKVSAFAQNQDQRSALQSALEHFVGLMRGADLDNKGVQAQLEKQYDALRVKADRRNALADGTVRKVMFQDGQRLPEAIRDLLDDYGVSSIKELQAKVGLPADQQDGKLGRKTLFFLQIEVLGRLSGAVDELSSQALSSLQAKVKETATIKVGLAQWRSSSLQDVLATNPAIASKLAGSGEPAGDDFAGKLAQFLRSKNMTVADGALVGTNADGTVAPVSQAEMSRLKADFETWMIGERNRTTERLLAEIEKCSDPEDAKAALQLVQTMDGDMGIRPGDSFALAAFKASIRVNREFANEMMTGRINLDLMSVDERPGADRVFREMEAAGYKGVVDPQSNTITFTVTQADRDDYARLMRMFEQQSALGSLLREAATNVKILASMTGGSTAVGNGLDGTVPADHPTEEGAGDGQNMAADPDILDDRGRLAERSTKDQISQLAVDADFGAAVLQPSRRLGANRNGHRAALEVAEKADAVKSAVKQHIERRARQIKEETIKQAEKYSADIQERGRQMVVEQRDASQVAQATVVDGVVVRRDRDGKVIDQGATT